MIVRGRVKKGRYFDSVTLMRVARKVGEAPGVQEAAALMGTPENRQLLQEAGLMVPEFSRAAATDLLIAVKAEDAPGAEAALQLAEQLLAGGEPETAGEVSYRPAGLSGALEILPEARLALISVPGRYAAAEARKALRRGLHVMIFSDNVPVEEEIALKTYAREHGLLVMGPDCGTAIIGGTPLGFANAVPRGNIGIVAAAGTGLQEVSCLIAREGGGISHALGTGGRDVKAAVGGIAFLQALEALAGDAATEVIVLVAKPPEPPVLTALGETLSSVDKPVVTALLGAGTAPELARHPHVHQTATLEEAALLAQALAGGGDVAATRRRLQQQEAEYQELGKALAARCAPGRRYIRGLFSGGTLCAEAQVILSGMFEEDIHSNVPFGATRRLKDVSRSQGHTLIDFGDDEFTVGRPHPMIDFSLRRERLRQEAADPETAVILLDVVLGYGAHPDPAGELAPVIEKVAGDVGVICSITGTGDDPQNRSQVETALRSAGAQVLPSNAAASKVAGYAVRALAKNTSVHR